MEPPRNPRPPIMSRDRATEIAREVQRLIGLGEEHRAWEMVRNLHPAEGRYRRNRRVVAQDQPGYVGEGDFTADLHLDIATDEPHGRRAAVGPPWI